MVGIQVSVLCLLAMGLMVGSLKLFASPVLCQFSLRRLFPSFGNATSLSKNITIVELDTPTIFNHTSAYISILQKRLTDAETEVMCCRQDLITMRVNVTESQRELSQCKFQNTCYEQQLFDAEDRISYLEEALFNMTVSGNATLANNASSVVSEIAEEASGSSNSTDGSTSETMQKLLHSGGATPNKKSVSVDKKKANFNPSNKLKSSTSDAVKKVSLLQRIFGRKKQAADPSIEPTTKVEKVKTAPVSIGKQANKATKPSSPSNSVDVVMSEAEAVVTQYQAKSEALMISLSLQQKTIDELRRELEQLSSKEGLLIREQQLLLQEKQELIALQEEQWEKKRQELTEELTRSYANTDSSSPNEVITSQPNIEEVSSDISELIEDIAMKDVELLQLRKRIELLQSTSEEEDKRHRGDVEELQQRIQTMIDEAERAVNMTTVSSAAGEGSNGNVASADELTVWKENQKLRQEVSTANITIEFLQQQLMQLKQDHSKQHSTLKNVITQLEATSGYKPAITATPGENVANALAVPAERKHSDSLIVAVAKCLGNVVSSVKRCIQKFLDFLHDL